MATSDFQRWSRRNYLSNQTSFLFFPLLSVRTLPFTYIFCSVSQELDPAQIFTKLNKPRSSLSFSNFYQTLTIALDLKIIFPRKKDKKLLSFLSCALEA